jgi:hypothetical protein
MELTDWIVVLAIALMAIAFYCSRSGRRAALADRARHRRGMRLLMQGAIAFWSALLVLDRSFVSPGALPALPPLPAAPFGLRLSAHAVLAVSLVLVVAGCSWTMRGLRLVRTRHLFGAS